MFQQALANLPRFEWRGVPFAAWLQRIAANAIADRWQAAQRESGVPERAPASEEDIERRTMLFRLVDTLPADQRRVRAKWNEAKAPTSSFNGARCRACGNWRGGRMAAKRSLADRFDELIAQMLVAERGTPVAPHDRRIASLARLADDLLDLPRPSFKARPKNDLERRARNEYDGS